MVPKAKNKRDRNAYCQNDVFGFHSSPPVNLAGLTSHELTDSSRACRVPSGLRFVAHKCHAGEFELFINLIVGLSRLGEP